MRMKKVLAALLALMLALMPMALAEGFTGFSQGSVTLKISDLVFSYTDGGETVSQDLTGLGVQLGGVLDSSGDQSANGLMSLMLLANEEPTVSSMLGMQGDQVYALASGISNVLIGTLEDWEKLVGSELSIDLSTHQLEAPMAMFTQSAQAIEELQFTQGPAETVEFYGSSGEYPRFSAALTNAQLKDMLGDSISEIPDDMSLDVSYFTDDGANVRVEGTIHNVIESNQPEERDMDFVVVSESQESGIVNIGGYLGNDTGDVNIDFNGAPDETYPEHYAFQSQIDVVDQNEPDSSTQIQLTLSPGEAEDGAVADVFSASMFEGEELAGTLNYVVSVTDVAESYWLTVSDATGEDTYNLGYEGTIETGATDHTHSGVLQFDAKANAQSTSGQLKLSLNLSTDIQGKLPDVASMDSINVADISTDQMEQLTGEAQTLFINAMGKLMAVPSIAALISSAMQSGALNF